MMEKKSKKNVPKKNSEKKMLEKKYSKTNVPKKSFNKNILVSEILTSVAVNKLTCLSLFIHSFILVSLLHSSCLILSSLLSLMATLEEEIRDLKAEIVKFTVWLDKAVADGNEGKEERYADLITAKEARLLFLLQQQPQGK